MGALGSGLTGAPLRADDAPTAIALAPNEQEQVAAVTDYLNQLTTMQADFIQNNPNGTVWTGTVSLRRPDHFRFEYDDPIPHVLVTDGFFFIHHDKELGETTWLPMDRTPVYFMIRESIDFSDGVTITDFETEPGLVKITLVNDADPDLGQVTLVFSERPVALRQWVVLDAADNRTVVTLQNPRYGLELSDDLFSYIERERGSGPIE